MTVPKEGGYSQRDALVALALAAAVVLASLAPALIRRFAALQQPAGVYALAQVAEHDQPGDCWLVVDGLVFDLSDESKKHPALFSCGADGSENYHKNHGPTIRDRMMQFKVGELDAESKARGTFAAPVAVRAIAPTRTLFAPEGSWDPLDLMIVMERDNQSLLAIDSKTHTAVGRIAGIGERVHTQVFSPDGQFVYHISRDGWLTKISLRDLMPTGFIKVGTDSRGTAITDSGKYIAVGNYDPGEVVVVDAATLAIVARIPLGDTAGTVSSRAGGLVELGEMFAVSLKDSRSVWIIDSAQRGMPVVRRFWDIGEPGDILHDAFLTPDGNFFLTAVQGSDRVWVLNVRTWQTTEVVGVGKTPHTGPGAVWHNTVFVPSLGAGVLSAIDMVSWQVRALIPTGGAGLFVRGYPADPSYPYVWVDTAFGEGPQDAIEVIDARTLQVVKKLVPMPGKRAVHPEFTRDGKYVYVAVWGGDKVVVYDARTYEVVRTIDAITPTGISSAGLRIEEPGL